MICSVSINQSDLQKIGQYKLALRQILISPSSIKTKISLVNSLKQNLKVVLQRKLKKIQRQSIQQQECSSINKSKSMLSSLVFSKNQSKQMGGSFSMKSYHHNLMIVICNEYEIRNHLNITLYQLQKQIDKATYRYQRCFRQNDYTGQSKAILSIKQTQEKVRHILANLLQMNQSISIKYEILKDNINILKVKYSILKAQTPKVKLQKNKNSKIKIPILLIQDQNKNQYLVNL